ncbi:universal stress protein [Pseudophaeobacter profundi]|uniref:universal stress protein n=1 Tax=Pseudophaeobacter profundi TaxID=3034152 RepID=UPI00242F1CB0|nr:universal stress protein [Pseudophaeobacter profundi]
MPDIHSGSTIVDRPHGQASDARLLRHVMVCLDRSPDAARILEQAVLLANQTGADLTAMRVVPAVSSTLRCADPIDWELTKRDEIADLLRMSDMAGATTEIRAIVACGSATRCIHEEALRCDVDLLVLGTGTFGPPSRWGLGGTARHLAEVFHGSVLLVPDEIAGEPSRRRRIIVPMDGSPLSEAALRFAAAIARIRAAELVILHAVSHVGGFGTGRTGQGDEALWRELKDEAARTAEDRIQRLRRLLPAHRHGNRVRRLSGDEPRRALMKAICEERGELVVLSARGLGNDPDLPIGSTAEYLLSRAVTPVLLIRNAEMSTHRAGGTTPRWPAGLRQEP